MSKKKGRKSNKDKTRDFIENYDEVKRAHLKTLADKMLKDDEKNQKLKEKNINDSFLDLF